MFQINSTAAWTAADTDFLDKVGDRPRGVERSLLQAVRFNGKRAYVQEKRIKKIKEMKRQSQNVFQLAR